jgi:hypothetical protein
MPTRNANAGKTVFEILLGKRASIRAAPLEVGSPSWDAIAGMMWEEVVARAARDEPGFRTIRKLLSDRRFDK